MKARKLLKHIPVHIGSGFTWFKGSSGKVVGCAEASDFGRVLGKAGFCTPVYADACDEGFFVRSHKTGVEKLFVLSGTQCDGDGDVAGWVFEAADGSGLEIHIEND